ncbi:MAG: hypothetical protein K8S94_17735 [Planctomycetia bacterium]|nr:hypothetical protein [Planctomycetia bacterium]
MEQTTDYRPVSAWAVAALLVGVFSALAVVTRFAWGLPLLGVGLSVAALGDVARPGATKAGRPLALAGLALALGFGAQAVTAAAVSRWIVGHRARAAATVWIDAVRAGRMAEAIGVSAPTLLPPTASGPGAPAEENEAEERIERFATLPAVQALVACGLGRPAVLAASPVAADDGDWTVRVSLLKCTGQDATLRLVVTPRVVPSAGATVERWTVSTVDLDR